MAADKKEEKLAKADSKLPEVDVDAAARGINEILKNTLFKGTTEVGEYILKEFFRDDIELAQSHDPSKESSFRTLSKRCGTPELPVGKTYLNTAVGVAIMCRRLLADGHSPTYKDLPPSHQVALLPLRVPEKVEAFAKKVVKERWTVLEVKEDVRKVVARRKKSGRGRKAIPLVIKTLDRTLSRFTHESGGKAFASAEIRRLDEKQKKHALETMSALIESLTILKAQLKK